MKCNNCNFENEPNAVFCSNCGNQLLSQDADSNDSPQFPENSESSGYIDSSDQQPSTPEPVGQQPTSGDTYPYPPAQQQPPGSQNVEQPLGQQPIQQAPDYYGTPPAQEPMQQPVQPAQQPYVQPMQQPMQQAQQPYVQPMQPMQQAQQPYMQPMQPMPGQQPPKKKKRLGLIISLSAVAVILAVLAFLLFPRKISYESEDNPATAAEQLAEYNVEVKCNQGVREVFYTLNPENPDDLNSYLPVTGTGGLFKKTINLRNLPLKAGNNTLYLYTKTLFGNSKPEKIVLTRHVGFSSPYEEGAKQELDQGSSIIANELLVLLKANATRSDIENIARKYGAEIVGEIPIINEYQLRFSDPNIDLNQLQENISAEPEVEIAIFNMVHKIEGSSYPNDSLLDSWDLTNPEGNNWGLEVMRVPQAYEEGPEFGHIKAGVIDGSVQYDHEDLQIPVENVYIHPSLNIRNMEDLVRYRAKGTNEPGEDYMGLLRHGTHVTGTIGAITNNGLGVAGVNQDCEMFFFHHWHFLVDPATREILYYTSYEPEMSTFEFHVSVVTLASQDCRVINYSIGRINTSIPGANPWEQMETDGYGEVCTRLEELGYDFLLVKAAGNDTKDSSQYACNRSLIGTEAGKRHTLIVASIENTKVSTDSFSDTKYPAVAGYELSYFSNYGEIVDVAAPGTDIFNTLPYHEYGLMSGTSMAAPNAAGVASLIYAANPEYTSDQVKRILMEETDTFAPDYDGRAIPVVNAALAVQADAVKTDLVTANVLDANTREPIAEFNVVATAYDVPDISGTYRNGKYSETLMPGSYEFVFSAEGYNDEEVTQFTTIGEGKTVALPDILMTPESAAAGTVSGQVIDAVDGAGLTDVKLTFFSGDSQVQEINVDAEGRYSIDLPQGNYRMVGNKEGYIENETEVVSVADTNSDNQNLILSPNITSEQARFVLSWGEQPYDLDLHMKGPGMNGAEYGHVFWDDKIYPSADDIHYALDVDDTWSYGPETITIEKELPGEYIVYVHDFTNSYYDGDQLGTSSGLGNSGAKITAYTSTGVQTFEVPNQPGTLWKVLKYSNGVITPINEMSYEMFIDEIPTH
ncbi:MAG TPA: S8 family serine peptidase [Clostridiaceae bacterium]|nr:S8 family serine peptidase [Clostridiaceae bacterium]